jgi:photosystem II stability/assembly factor-like uncharacterized protein
VGFQNESRVYAAGVHGGQLYRSQDFGQSFRTLPNSLVRTDVRGHRSLLGITSYDVFHVGYRDNGGLCRPVIERTQDGGDYWWTVYEAPTRSKDRSFRAIAPVESGFCAVGTGGEVVLNRPGTSTWTRSRVAAPGADQLNLTDVAFLDRRTGWAVGDGGVILRY